MCYPWWWICGVLNVDFLYCEVCPARHVDVLAFECQSEVSRGNTSFFLPINMFFSWVTKRTIAGWVKVNQSRQEVTHAQNHTHGNGAHQCQVLRPRCWRAATLLVAPITHLEGPSIRMEHGDPCVGTYKTGACEARSAQRPKDKLTRGAPGRTCGSKGWGALNCWYVIWP